MAIELVVNGVTFDYPETGDINWGPDATDWAAAVTSGMLQKAGGLFQLLAEVDFGSGFGVKSLYLKSRDANPATSGVLRLGNTDIIAWRNQANDGDLALSVTAGDILEFNGLPFQGEISVSDTTTIDLSFAGNILSASVVPGSLVNTDISNSAAISLSKLESVGSASVVIGNASSVATAMPLTGDISITNIGATSINNDVVGNTKLTNMAAGTLKGRQFGSGTGDPMDLGPDQATELLDPFSGDFGSGGVKGLVPAPAPGDGVNK